MQILNLEEQNNEEVRELQEAKPLITNSSTNTLYPSSTTPTTVSSAKHIEFSSRTKSSRMKPHSTKKKQLLAKNVSECHTTNPLSRKLGIVDIQTLVNLTTEISAF